MSALTIRFGNIPTMTIFEAAVPLVFEGLLFDLRVGPSNNTNRPVVRSPANR